MANLSTESPRYSHYHEKFYFFYKSLQSLVFPTMITPFFIKFPYLILVLATYHQPYAFLDIHKDVPLENSSKNRLVFHIQDMYDTHNLECNHNALKKFIEIYERLLQLEKGKDSER